MSITPAKPVESEESQPLPVAKDAASTRGWVAWSSLFFALLQSVCTFFAAVDGLRLLIGVGALASVVGVGQRWDRLHADWIRVPMILLALVGSLLNLAILIQVRHLRNRPAAQWRRQPLTPRKLRRERLQMVLSLVTLALIVIEEVTHLHTFHHL